MAGQANRLGAPNRLFPDQSDPFAAQAPTQADAVQHTAQAYQAWLDQQRQSGVASGMIDPQTGWPTGNALLDAARQYGGAMIGGTSAPGFKVYHGSPHSFDKFDLGKIGTGEGNQAYGHGLYFADNEGVAQGYRDQLTARSAATDAAAAGRLDAFAKQMAARRAEVDAMGGPRRMVALKQLEWDEKDLARVQALPPEQQGKRGSMYEVQVNADPAHFLDWDKPLSAQHPVVQEAWQKAGLPDNAPKFSEPRQVDGGYVMDYQLPGGDPSTSRVFKTPEDAQRIAQSYKAPTAGEEVGKVGTGHASTALADAGLPGIRYLDGNSRADGSGSSNHVIFDPATIEILRKYGIAGLIGGGAAAGQQTQ